MNLTETKSIANQLRAWKEQILDTFPLGVFNDPADKATIQHALIAMRDDLIQKLSSVCSYHCGSFHTAAFLERCLRDPDKPDKIVLARETPNRGPDKCKPCSGYGAVMGGRCEVCDGTGKVPRGGDVT